MCLGLSSDGGAVVDETATLARSNQKGDAYTRFTYKIGDSVTEFQFHQGDLM
jgi:hypothetical protein